MVGDLIKHLIGTEDSQITALERTKCTNRRLVINQVLHFLILSYLSYLFAANKQKLKDLFLHFFRIVIEN